MQNVQASNLKRSAPQVKRSSNFNSICRELKMKSIKSSIKTKGPLPFPKSYVVRKAKIILYPKRDHLLRQISRFGVKLKQLTNLELIDLLYDVYNPSTPAVKKEKGAQEISTLKPNAKK